MRLFIWEVRKLAGDSAARAGLAIVCAVSLLALLAFLATSGDDGGATLTQKLAAGELPIPHACRKGLGFASFLLMPCGGLLIPVALCVVLAGNIAGEGESGTLAETLSRPVARWRIIAAKLGAGIAYAAALMCAAALAALVVAPLALGSGELMVGLSRGPLPDGDATVAGAGIAVQSLSGGAAVVRLVSAYAVAGLGLLPVVGLAMLASAAAERARAAAMVASGVYAGLYGLTRIPVLGSFGRYFLVGHMEAWQGLLKPEVEWGRLFSGGVVVLAAFGLLALAGILVFNGRELAPRE